MNNHKPLPPKVRHWRPVRAPIELVSFNDLLKEKERRGELGAYMAAWVAYERDREAAQ